MDRTVLVWKMSKYEAENDSPKTHTELKDYNTKIPGSGPWIQFVSLLFQTPCLNLSIQIRVK